MNNPVMTQGRDVWPAGPPHHFAGVRTCTGCGAAADRAVHDPTFWHERGVQLLTADELAEWQVRFKEDS